MFRSQFESAEEREARSRETAHVFDVTEDKARQEFKDVSDINFLIAQYGGNMQMLPMQVTPPEYGTADFDVDALTARIEAQTLQLAFSSLPEAIRAKYGSWQAVFAAIANGSLTTLEEKAEAVAEVSSAADAASPKAP